MAATQWPQDMSGTCNFIVTKMKHEKRAFDDVLMAQDIAEIDDDQFEPIKKVLFDTGDEESLPVLTRAQAGVLLEVMKDMFYQSFVRRGKLTRAIKVRHLFVQDGNGDIQTSA